MKNRKAKIILASILIFFAFIPSAVFAWISYSFENSFVEVESGKIAVSINVVGEIVSNEYPISNLMYVDFSEDIILDKTNTLNYISTNMIVKITSHVDSLPIKNRFSFIFPDEQDPLLYLIIYEGINLDENYPYVNDYHTFIESLMSVGDQTESLWREKIATYNQTTIDDIANIILDSEDTITIQVVFWGDHDLLEDPTTYLDQVYFLELVIQTVQGNREW